MVVFPDGAIADFGMLLRQLTLRLGEGLHAIAVGVHFVAESLELMVGCETTGLLGFDAMVFGFQICIHRDRWLDCRCLCDHSRGEPGGNKKPDAL